MFLNFIGRPQTVAVVVGPLGRTAAPYLLVGRSEVAGAIGYRALQNEIPLVLTASVTSFSAKSKSFESSIPCLSAKA